MLTVAAAMPLPASSSFATSAKLPVRVPALVFSLPLIVREFFRIVRHLNETEGLTVLVVEQDARSALNASSRAYVLEVGRVALTGTSEELRGDESIRRSYLGY